MRLTVGRLPAAVYWRRRMVVLVGLAIVVLIVAYACSGGPSSAGPAGPSNAGVLTPTTAGPTSSQPRPTVDPTTATPTPTPFTLPHTDASGPCTDSEIALTASASPASVPSGAATSFTLTIKNISTRTCARDIGAGPQELMLLNASGVTVWSSNDCSNDNSHDVETLTAGKIRSFTLTWNGLRSRSGTSSQTCTNATSPDPGDYQLVARLDTLKSAPFILHILP